MKPGEIQIQNVAHNMMKPQVIALGILLAPLALLFTAYLSRLYPGRACGLVKRSLQAATWLNLAVAALGALAVAQYQQLETGLLGTEGLGFSLRLDPLSMLMLGMIALLAWVIVRFSFRYLEGDARQGAFLGRLALTIATVELLVLSGNLMLLVLAWSATSWALHRLLVFYPQRKKAIMAARKKFLAARLSDLSLLAAAVLLYVAFGTGNLQDIFNAIESGSHQADGLLATSAVLLALAAIFKSAQFPTHGWLVEVMETPTPVSALLHAGLLNAGPFLLVRLAYVMADATAASAVLIIVGGFTGLFASASFLTQPSVKTALGYSSIAHMGFMLMVCGLGVFPAAMLHLVAHSFYKAHAFLSSGSVVDGVRAQKVALPKRLGSYPRMVASLGLAALIYLGVAWVFGINPTEEFALLATGIIVLMGITQMITPAMDMPQNGRVLLVTALLATLVTTAFFGLEGTTHHLLLSQLPEAVAPGLLLQSITVLLLAVYGLAIVGQMVAPAMAARPYWRRLGIHLRNGFYANAMLDRLVGALSREVADAAQPAPHPAPERMAPKRRHEALQEVAV